MLEDIDQILFSEEKILESVALMAQGIENQYRGKSLTVVTILNGSILFFTDLIRLIRMPLRIECIYAQSYKGGTRSTGVVDILTNQDFDVKNSDVLIIDDILDTGLTLSKVRKEVAQRGAHEIRTAVMLKKNVERVRHVEADFYGFEIDDLFVVGYGLDYKGYYRNLPFIATLKESAIRKHA